MPKGQRASRAEYGKELIHGCVVLPSPVGPMYVPLILEAETIDGAPTGQYTVREALTTVGHTPMDAFDKAHKRILEIK